MPGAWHLLTIVYRNRFLRAITLSAVFLQMGIWIRNLAILLFVMERTGGSPRAVSLISVAEFAPIFLFSFVGGTLADRWRPRHTMIWCDALSAVSVFAVLLAMMVSTWKAVFFVTLVSAILSQFSQPSFLKLCKIHLPGQQLQLGLAAFQTLTSVFMVLGPVVGTFIYQKFGLYVAVGIMGAAFAFSALALSFLPPDLQAEDKPGTCFWSEMGAGFRYVWSKKILAVIGGVYLTGGLAVGVTTPLGIFVVTELLGLPKQNLQWLMAANGTALLIGGGLVTGLAVSVAPQKLLALGLLVSAMSAVGIGKSANLPQTIAFQFLGGLFLPCIQVGAATLILRTATEAFVGRVNGVLSPLFMGGMVTAMSQAGWLKTQVSLGAVYEIAGALFLTGTLLLIPLLRILHLQGPLSGDN